MTNFAIAGLQLEAENGNNVEGMLAEIDSAVKRFPWLDMVVLGELNACADKASAEPMPGPTEGRFRAIAREHIA